MSDLVPGELLPADGEVTINEGRETATVAVENTGDRPVQVGSHYHFFEANPDLDFDREAAYGMRLDIPAGTAIRFEPGTEREVDLVAIGGNRIVHGMAGLVNGDLDDSAEQRSADSQAATPRDAETKERALETAAEAGFAGAEK